MPDPSLSAAIKEAYASAPQSVVILHTLELRHAAFVAPIRVVRDNEDLEATLEDDAPEDGGETVTFLAVGFSLKLPDVLPGSIPEIEIEIDNVSSEIEENLELAAASGTQIDVIYRPYLSTDLSSPHMIPPLMMQATGAKGTTQRVRLRAGFPRLSDRQFPSEDYTGKRFPGLVR